MSFKGTHTQGLASDLLRAASGLPSRRRSLHALLTRSQSRDKDVESQREERPEPLPALNIPGPAALLGVAFLWGTYSPALRALYSLPGPPDPAALTAARGVIQAGSLWVASLWMTQEPELDKGKNLQSGGATASRAGIELGFWNFLATSLQAIGLERTTAVRSAFIIQATSILTPVLATVSGEWPRRNVWFGCLVALGSTVLITLDSMDGTQQDGHPTTLVSLGDAAVLGAAFFYSVATVRLRNYAQQLPAISVASAKSNALAAWSVLWLVSLAVRKGMQDGAPVTELWEGVSHPLAWLLIFWSALGPGALAAFLQTQGQKDVPSSQAQVYYSSTPIWSALLAMLLLEGEMMGWLGWLGGGGVVLAGLLASR